MKNIAILTGASSGIGEAFLREIVSDNGFDEIWIVARRLNKLEALKAELDSTRIVPIAADLTKPQDLTQIEDKLVSEKPHIALLINCAGMGKRGLIENKPKEAVSDTIDVNCTSLSLLTKICMPYITDKPGARIINIASSAAFLPQPGFTVYAASKAYVVSFSRALAYELKKYGTKVTTVCPGPVKTEFQTMATDGKSGDFTGFRKFVVADPVKLAKGSLKASQRGRKMYVYGISQKALHLAGKIVPTDLILSFMSAED